MTDSAFTIHYSPLTAHQMQLLLTYIIKLSVALTVVYAFYALFLRRLTFYNWNRWYLVGYSLLAFIIPFVDITPVLEEHALEGDAMVRYIPVMDYRNLLQQPEQQHWTLQHWMLLLIAVGILVMLCRLLVQHYSLYRLRSKARLLHSDSVKLYQVDAPIMPFSYGKAIYVNAAQHGEDELREIIRHEFVHVSQQHTVDMLWSEALCIVNWFNPFAWLLRKAIRQNLEYIADRQVLQHGMDRKAYQYLLLKVIGVQQFSFAAPFNFTSLKNRIVMMNKMRSAKTQLLKFAFLLPLLVVLLLAFRNAAAAQEQVPVPPVPPEAPAAVDTIPAPPKPRMPEGVKNIRINRDIATVTRKDGKVETYDMTNAAEKAAYVKKYGELPEPPPPPPTPVAPKAPKAPKAPVEKLAAPEAPVAPDAKTIPDPVAPVPPVGVKNQGIPAPGADATIIVAPKDADYIIKADRIEFKEATAGRPTISSMQIKGLTDPLYIIDGVKRKDLQIAALDPAMISEVNVLKDKAATALYGEEGKNGVVIIKTKQYTTQSDKVNITVKKSDAAAQDPLYIINGKEYDKAGFEALNIDPNTIASINVLKGENAEKKYGAKGKNGVVEVNLK